MRSAMAVRIKRTLMALLLMFVLSFTGAFAETEIRTENAGVTVQTEVSAESGGGTVIEEPAPVTGAKAKVIKKGKNYYYKNAYGKIRKKAGFVTADGKSYYVKKGGKIIVNDVFSVKNIPYAADAEGCATMIGIPDGDGSPVVAKAKKQVGKMTGKKYWKWYYKTKFVDTDRTPWCGAFVAWCYNEAGLYKKITAAKKIGSLGYVPNYSRYADKYGKWVKINMAKGGDIIVFGKNRHIGLVEGVVGEYIITIEGNAGPTALIGCGKPGAVIRNIYKINSKRIKGVIRPGR